MYLEDTLPREDGTFAYDGDGGGWSSDREGCNVGCNVGCAIEGCKVGRDEGHM